MYAIAAYPHALRMALGKLDASEDINRLLPASMREAIVGYRNQPNAILYQIGLGVAEEVRKKNIDGAVHGRSTVSCLIWPMHRAGWSVSATHRCPCSFRCCQGYW